MWGSKIGVKSHAMIVSPIQASSKVTLLREALFRLIPIDGVHRRKSNVVLFSW
jgi:hypothetical protein